MSKQNRRKSRLEIKNLNRREKSKKFKLLELNAELKPVLSKGVPKTRRTKFNEFKELRKFEPPEEEEEDEPKSKRRRPNRAIADAIEAEEEYENNFKKA